MDKHKKLIIEMIQDSLTKNSLYTAGKFWKDYESNIVRQVLKRNLLKFRSWEGGSGVGNIQSFFGGSEIKNRNFKRNFHPFDSCFEWIDDNNIVKLYNNLINKLIPFVPFLKFFLVRIKEAKNYHKEIHKLRIEEKYYLIKKLDQELIDISDSAFGIDEKEIIKIENKIYTNKFLDELLTFNHIKKNTQFSTINSILEIGAGYGMLASIFLKKNKNIKYCIIDIPPSLFFSEFFLTNIGFKVFGYEEAKKITEINITEIFNKYDVICLPSWDINKIKNFTFDLFINCRSFQEMEKKQVINYLSKIKLIVGKYLYLHNNITGHISKSPKKDNFGVKNPINQTDVEKYLSDKFSILNKEVFNLSYKIIFNKKDI